MPQARPRHGACALLYARRAACWLARRQSEVASHIYAALQAGAQSARQCCMPASPGARSEWYATRGARSTVARRHQSFRPFDCAHVLLHEKVLLRRRPPRFSKRGTAATFIPRLPSERRRRLEALRGGRRTRRGAPNGEKARSPRCSPLRRSTASRGNAYNPPASPATVHHHPSFRHPCHWDRGPVCHIEPCEQPCTCYEDILHAASGGYSCAHLCGRE